MIGYLAVYSCIYVSCFSVFSSALSFSTRRPAPLSTFHTTTHNRLQPPVAATAVHGACDRSRASQESTAHADCDLQPLVPAKKLDLQLEETPSVAPLLQNGHLLSSQTLFLAGTCNGCSTKRGNVHQRTAPLRYYTPLCDSRQ